MAGAQPARAWAVEGARERFAAGAGGAQCADGAGGLLQLMARGLSNQEIASELALVESTVKGHVSCLLDLMGAGNRTACVQQAFRLGLLSPREALDT